MKRILFFNLIVFLTVGIFAQHNAGTKGKVLLVVSNASVNTITGWPIGAWFAEITHPYWEFTEAGYTVEFASPLGGKIELDAFSDPEDAGGYSAFDFISLGFKKDPKKMALLENTKKLSDVNPDDFKALFICGGQGPMFTFVNDTALHRFFVNFYLTGKPSAAICHGTVILLKAKLPNGKHLVEGKRWTGFASSEEQYADNYVGTKIQPFRIEDEARKMPNSRFEVAEPFASFAVEDGNLITGQQQNSGTAAARLVLKQLEKDKKRYNTYVLVHGAWADESAWGYIRNSLAVHANVEVVNLPAHGIDLTPAGSVSLRDYVNDVVEVIKKQDGKVILVGHSMAGVIISQAAEDIPEKIKKLVYVSAYVPKDGDDLMSLSKADSGSLVGGALEFSGDYSTATIKKEMIAPAVCDDCPDYMKDILVKYHKAEPLKPFNEKVTLTGKRFGTIDKYYIYTSADKAVGYQLQQKMVRENGTFKKTFVMDTSHLPFVVKPVEFVTILRSIK